MPTAELAAALPAPPAGRILVGYSGGMDSHVLLHLAWRRYGAGALAAIHVHHGLSPHADVWLNHCATTCAGLGVAFCSQRVDGRQGHGGPEANARAARYGAFVQLVGEGDLLLLAHHAEDQAETVLYRLLRGGAAIGMPAMRPLGQGRLARPLLPFSRHQLRAYAEGEGLCWIEDESNAALQADRNYLRHQVVPALMGRWPDAVARLGRAAVRSELTTRLQGDLAQSDLAELDERPARVGRSLDLQRLLALPAHRRDNLLRHWLPAPGLPVPGDSVLASLVRDLARAEDDTCPLVSWSGGQWRRYRNRLHLLPPGWGGNPMAERGPWRWSPEQPLLLPDGARLQASPVLGTGLRAMGELLVRYRQGGERVQPLGRWAATSLKKALQESGLEPWLRDRVPLIEAAGQIVAVGDLFVCAAAVPGPDEPGWRLVWQYPER